MNACHKIVIIEDDLDIREAVRDVLELEGYHVRAYANGREAMDGLQSGDQPCLILLDLMMPVMNGWEFLEARKDLGHTITAIPVFIVSAIGDQAASNPNVRGYVKKPVDIEILLRIVKKHCAMPDLHNVA